MKQVNKKNKIEVTIKKEINISDLLDKVEKLANKSRQRSLFVKMDYEIVDEIISCLKYIDEQKKKEKDCLGKFESYSSKEDCDTCEVREECKLKSKKYCFGNYWVSIACMLCNMSSLCKQASKNKGIEDEKVD